MEVDSSYEVSRKRKKSTKKLLNGERVEVLYTDEGLNGSWHIGTVIGCRKYTRIIEYTNLQSDNDDGLKLVESIRVSSAIEGLHEEMLQNYRGNIRPSPPQIQIQESDIRYGLCVDALVDDAWWEGVVFDRADGSKERLIFFPDQGDQQTVALDNLRLTQEWNEVTSKWKIRGEWLMLRVLQPFEREEELPVSIREIWFDLRSTKAFLEKIGMWTFGAPYDWQLLVSGLIEELQSIVHGVITICSSDIEISTKDLPWVDGGINLISDDSNENACLSVSFPDNTSCYERYYSQIFSHMYAGNFDAEGRKGDHRLNDKKVDSRQNKKVRESWKNSDDDDDPISTCKKSKRQRSRKRARGTRKRPREILVQASNYQHVAKTVLSLLINNDMILPRQKVRYVRNEDGQVLMEGQITRDGIKCKCCKMVRTLSDFEAHAGCSANQQPFASIFLQDGRSLLECEMQMIRRKKPANTPRSRLKGDCSRFESDGVCSACHDGGTLLLCDHCPSSFHLSCVGLENVPKGKWFCPSCRCAVCGTSEFDSVTEYLTEKTILYCDQCEREYHVGCTRNKDSSLNSCPDGNWFCNKKCSKIFLHLRQLLGKSNPTPVEGLSWTILRSSREKEMDDLQFDVETVVEHDIKLCVALDVLHECFVSIVEPRTKSDFVADMVFNRESELRRLNFYGFYTMLLEKGDELISVATFRVYGDKVAEMPLVGTRIKFRRQGMCRLLVNELEKVLSELGVERLVLPSIPQLLKTWTSSFGFSKMSSSERLDLLEYTTLTFQDTTMCCKLLTSPTVQENPNGGCPQTTQGVSV